MTSNSPPARALLIWDAPNMDMGLSTIVGGRPNSYQRPRFDAAGLWLLQQGAAVAAEENCDPENIICEATLFTNVNESNIEGIHSWIDALRNIGFSVFAKPKETADSDVDEDMLRHLSTRLAEGNLKLVVIASADGRNFQATLDDLAAQGIRAIVLGFAEECTWAMEDPNLTFVDVEEIEGLFQHPLPRMDLEHLPSGGAWLQPFRPLRALLHRATDRSDSIVPDDDKQHTSQSSTDPHTKHNDENTDERSDEHPEEALNV